MRLICGEERIPLGDAACCSHKQTFIIAGIFVFIYLSIQMTEGIHNHGVTFQIEAERIFWIRINTLIFV